MSLLLTKSALEHIRDMTREQPLQPGELRRIVGMGALNIAFSENNVEKGSYAGILTLEIDGHDSALDLAAQAW